MSRTRYATDARVAGVDLRREARHISSGPVREVLKRRAA